MFCLSKFCQEINFLFSGFIFWFQNLSFLCYRGVFTPSKNFSKMLLCLYTFSWNISFIRRIIYMMIFPELYFLKKWFFISSRALFALQPFQKILENPTKIWGWHMMSLNHFYAKISFGTLKILSFTPSFQIWSSGQFCTTTYLSISLKLPPKLGEVSRSILFILVQKPTNVLWKIWANHPLFLSGPVWHFLLQPHFILLCWPWFFFLLIVHPTKPLSPGEWTHWGIFGPWKDSL